jgi:hypothetical protein
MRRVWGVLIMLIVAAFALPAMINAIEALIPALIAAAALVGVGALLFRRRRYW